MNNNIGVFTTHYLWPSHFETDLEIIQENINLGNNVTVYHCKEQIEQCELIWIRSIKQNLSFEVEKEKICAWCKSKQKAGFELIDGKFKKHALINQKEIKKHYELDVAYLESSEKLKEIRIDDNYDIGWSLLSSLISSYRNPFIEVSKHEKELSVLYQDCVRIYNSTKAYIKEHNLNEVYVFNGRLSYTKAILQAARKMEVPCYVHERGGKYTKYSLFKNHTVHDLRNITERIKDDWELNEEIESKQEIANEFYVNRSKGILGSWSSFLDKQDRSALPEQWNEELFNIVVYTSSEDEFASISDEWRNPLFDSQLAGLHKICEIVADKNDINVYIRVHPNTENMETSYKDSLKKLDEYENVFLIDHDSPVSSYMLMNKADKIVTFGSTIGMEAVYWKKPSVLLAKTLYYYLKGPYLPKDLKEVEELILDKNLTIPEEDDALMYGYFLNSFGQDFKHYKPTDYKSGTFKGVNLNVVEGIKPNIIIRVINKLRRIIGLKNI